MPSPGCESGGRALSGWLLRLGGLSLLRLARTPSSLPAVPCAHQVARGGKTVLVKNNEVVVGDILLLDTGEAVRGLR